MSYKSPIELLAHDIKMEIEDNIYRAVQGYGIKVDKSELVKALEYDRGQYDKGYADGQADAVKHGQWYCLGTCTTMFFCSRCGSASYSADPYCWHCGARMDGEEDDEAD